VGELLSQIIDAVRANQHLAYGLVLVLSFSESLPIIGSFIPGTTIIVAISALVPSGAIDIRWLLGVAILGAILGDGFSYWLGHKYRDEIGNMWPLRRYPGLISIGRDAIVRHGGKSIFIARFTPALRAIVPLVAGILGMDARRFYIVNIVSAVGWAVAHIVPAVIAGASLAIAGAVGGRLLVLLSVLLTVLWLILVVVRNVMARGLPLLARSLLNLWHWARHHDNWVSREILSLLDPSHHEIKGLLLLVTLLVGGTWAFFAILEDVVTGAPLVRADEAVFNFMQSVRTLWIDRAMVVVNELGDVVVVSAVIAATVFWLAAMRAWRALAYWLGGIVFAGLFVQVLRLILHVPRPAELYGGLSAYGFPSGHMAVTATVYGFLALLVCRELKPTARTAFAMLATILVSLIAFARLYLGANWVSDVAAGLAFASAWVAGLGIVYMSHQLRPVRVGGLIAVSLAVLIASGTLHAQAAFRDDMRRYAVRTGVVRMTAAYWWSDGWSRLPTHRVDLAGGLGEPMVLQWVGALPDLRARLIEHGWREPPPLTLASQLAWLETGADLNELPVLTRLHDGRPTRLILIRTDESKSGRPARLILRIWRAPVAIMAGGEEPYRLWLGSVVEQRVYHIGSFVAFGLSRRDESAPRALLEEALAPVRVAYRHLPPDRWGWDGWVLLGHDPSISLPQEP
jgi:undecaprenyl-diphosphatase